MADVATIWGCQNRNTMLLRIARNLWAACGGSYAHSWYSMHENGLLKYYGTACLLLSVFRTYYHGYPNYVGQNDNKDLDHYVLGAQVGGASS